VISIKFLSDLDKQKFLCECSLENLSDLESVSEEVYSVFIKNRQTLVNHMKDFRKKQITKQSWVAHRWKYLIGIRKFHRSLAGKRFHRHLADYLATRFVDKRPGRTNVFETLKSISSIKTHFYIYGEYYKSLEDDIDYLNLLEYSIPLLTNLELSIYNPDSYYISDDRYISEDDDSTELLLRIVDQNELASALSTVINKDKSEILSRIVEESNTKFDDTYLYLNIINEFKN
jgi:hypothetical protein